MASTTSSSLVQRHVFNEKQVREILRTTPVAYQPKKAVLSLGKSGFVVKVEEGNAKINDRMVTNVNDSSVNITIVRQPETEAAASRVEQPMRLLPSVVLLEDKRAATGDTATDALRAPLNTEDTKRVADVLPADTAVTGGVAPMPAAVPAAVPVETWSQTSKKIALWAIFMVVLTTLYLWYMSLVWAEKKRKILEAEWEDQGPPFTHTPTGPTAARESSTWAATIVQGATLFGSFGVLPVVAFFMGM